MLYEKNVRYKDEKCNNLIEQEVDGNTSLTFILCVSVAGAVSKQLREESIKLKLPLGYDELSVGDVADMFGGTKSGYKVSSKLFKINAQKRPDGYTYLSGTIPVLQEIQTENELLKHHKTIIAIPNEEEGNKIEGVLTVWLEIRSYIEWFEDCQSPLRLSYRHKGMDESCIASVNALLEEWGEEKTRYKMDLEIDKFKRLAKEKKLYQSTSEEFYKQIGMILVAYKIVKKQYGLHTKKKELIEFIFANITPTWHGKIVKQCCRNERGC